MFADLLFLPEVTMHINKYTGFQHILKEAMKEMVNEAFLQRRLWALCGSMPGPSHSLSESK